MSLFPGKPSHQQDRPDGYKAVVIGYKVEAMTDRDGNVIRNDDGSPVVGIFRYDSGKDDDVYRNFLGSILRQDGQLSWGTKTGHHLSQMLEQANIEELADSDVDGTMDEIIADSATSTFGGFEVRFQKVDEYIPFEGFNGSWKNFRTVTEVIGKVEDQDRLKALRTKAKALAQQQAAILADALS